MKYLCSCGIGTVNCTWIILIASFRSSLSFGYLPRSSIGVSIQRHVHSKQRMSTSSKREAPSAERNKAVIWETLTLKIFPKLLHKDENDELSVLEVAAGAGVHTGYFGSQFLKTYPQRSFTWFPTDADHNSNRKSQEAYIDEIPGLESYMHKPLSLTLNHEGIQEESTRKKLPQQIDLIVCINMVHISPWSATIGLMKESGNRLQKDGLLYLYGPYRVNGKCTESNM